MFTLDTIILAGVVFVLGVVAAMIWGYFWNYYLIKELKEMNYHLRNLENK